MRPLHVQLPASKSLTNRLLVMAALSQSCVTLTGITWCEDVQHMVSALEALGFATQRQPESITIQGHGGHIPKAKAHLTVGNAGTVARFLTALVCLQPQGHYTMQGDAAMQHRPMQPLWQALQSLGALAYAPKHLPWHLTTQGLAGGSIHVDAHTSSQYISALSLVAPMTSQGLHITWQAMPSRPFVQMTASLLQQIGLSVHIDAQSLHIQGQQHYTMHDTHIPRDATAASYFAAWVILNQKPLVLANYTPDALQGDHAFLELLSQHGLLQLSSAPGGLLLEPGTHRCGITADLRDYSDTFLTLAALAPCLTSPTHLTGLAHTRAQECDRIQAMAEALHNLGQAVTCTHDSLTIVPKPNALREAALQPITLNTHHDHRVAMSLGILGTYRLPGAALGWLQLDDPSCVAKTFPNYWDTLKLLNHAHPTA